MQRYSIHPAPLRAVCRCVHALATDSTPRLRPPPLHSPGEGETWLFKEKAGPNAGALVAIKLIKRPIPKPAIAVIKREIKIQADLGQGHLNIVSADEVVLTKSHLGLIMEFVPGAAVLLGAAGLGDCLSPAPGSPWHTCERAQAIQSLRSASAHPHSSGGNMVNFVTRRRETKHERGGLCLDEDEARYYFVQLLSAVEYCHKHQVAHRWGVAGVGPTEPAALERAA